MLLLEMVAWAGLLPVFWTLWQPWTIQHGAMGLGTSMAYLSSKLLRMAKRRLQKIGLKYAFSKFIILLYFMQET